MANFCDRVKYLRSTSEMSQNELADKIGVSRQAVSMYESGSRVPTLEILEALADTFNVDMDYLTGRTDLTTRLLKHPAVGKRGELFEIVSNATDEQIETLYTVFHAIAKVGETWTK